LGKKSILAILQDHVLDYDAGDFIDNVESQPYYLKTGVACNHDIMLLRIYHVLRLLFRVVTRDAAADEDTLAIMHETIIQGLRGYLPYQVCAVEKMFCLLLLKQNAWLDVNKQQDTDHPENPYFIQLPLFLELCEWMKVNLVAALKDDPDHDGSPLLARLVKLDRHVEDYAWRARILAGLKGGINGAQYVTWQRKKGS
jgi:hypothetical protein